MRVEDWRHLPASLVEPLYEAEVHRWRVALNWDTRQTLDTVEQARQAGTLPGFVLRGPGQSVVGWTYFVVQDGVVQLGSLLARSSDGLRLLLDGVLKAPEVSVAREIMCFAFPGSSACESALARRRFDVTRYWYLRRALDPGAQRSEPSDGLRLRMLRDSDGPDLVRLLARAYEGLETARCFAPGGGLDEWAHYFAQMTRGSALGALVPEATLVADGQNARPVGLAVTTIISPATLHLAQLAVDPADQGQGVGGQLLDAAMARGVGLGHRLMTLLVSNEQAVGHGLYASRGFLPTGYFLYARRPVLRRSFPQHAPAPAGHNALR
jgi:ribosomal protein S18 acetylase RimI-like enzyme